jgi:hypothetical protein
MYVDDIAAIVWEMRRLRLCKTFDYQHRFPERLVKSAAPIDALS